MGQSWRERKMREEDTNSGSFLDKEKRKGLRVKVVDEKKKRKKKV